MKILPRKLHGYLDYIMGIILIMAPYLLGFANSGAGASTPITCGITLIVYSILTNYEMGIIKILPFKLHLLFDFTLGGVLTLSPWLLGYENLVWAPHVLVGMTIMIVSIITQLHRTITELPSGKHF